MCSSMRVFCAFIWIAHLGRGTSDPFHERRRAHPDRLGEVVGGGLSASGHVDVCTVDEGRVNVADVSGDDVDRDAGHRQRMFPLDSQADNAGSVPVTCSTQRLFGRA